MNGISKGYLRVAVATTIPWTKCETTLEFGGHKLTLSPETEQHMPSLLVEFGDGFPQNEALQLLSEFATALAYAEGQAVNLTIMTTCTSRNLMLGKPPSRGPVGLGRFDYLPRPTDPRAKLALALFREGLTVNLVPYQFLAFCRIINLHVGQSGNQQILWINAELPHISQDDVIKRIADLAKIHADVGEYLYAQGRCAAAHASLTTATINPDNPADLVRLHGDLLIVRALATRIIEYHLNVKSLRTIRDEHEYELDGFRAVLATEDVAALKRGEDVGITRLAIPSVLSVRLRGHAPFEVFENLRATVVDARSGAIRVRCTSTDDLVTADVILDFVNERLHFDSQHLVEIRDEGSALAARYRVSELLFWRDWWAANGSIELWANDRLMGCADPYIPPVNSRFDHKAYKTELNSALEEARIRTERECVAVSLVSNDRA